MIGDKNAPVSLVMTINSSYSYSDSPSLIGQQNSRGSTVPGFSTALADADSVNISSTASANSSSQTPASLLLEYGTTNSQIISYDEKMASNTDPGFTLFYQSLTPGDKEMLAGLQGGGWAENGPANHLVDQIATARGDGSLQGPVTSNFIQNIITNQSASDMLNSKQTQIPMSVLNAALSWISAQD